MLRIIYFFCDANDFILSSYIQWHVCSVHIITHCYIFTISLLHSLYSYKKISWSEPAQKAGLCNYTRLQVLQMGTINIEAWIISGGKVGTVCAIQRMIISPSDAKMHSSETIPCFCLFRYDLKQKPMPDFVSGGFIATMAYFSHYSYM